MPVRTKRARSLPKVQRTFGCQLSGVWESNGWRTCPPGGSIALLKLIKNDEEITIIRRLRFGSIRHNTKRFITFSISSTPGFYNPLKDQ